MNYKLAGYALDFASFLLEKLGDDAKEISQIILFGSVARGEAGEQSDIDLFIEADEKLENKLSRIRDDFYNSIKIRKYWQLLGIKNPINLSVGNLKDWGDLQRSIIANGIILYGRYYGKPEIKQHYLFVVSPGKNRNKNIALWRKLYGYSQKIGKKFYIREGLIKEYKGEKRARAVFTIPIEKAQEMILFLRKNKVNFQIIPFWLEKSQENFERFSKIAKKSKFTEKDANQLVEKVKKSMYKSLNK